MGIKSFTSFAVCSTVHSFQGYTSDQLVLFEDMILPVKQWANHNLIRQLNKAFFNYNNFWKSMSRIDYDYQGKGKIIIIKKETYNYKTPYKGPYEIIQCCTKSTLTLKMGNITDRMNMCRINTYTYEDT